MKNTVKTMAIVILMAFAFIGCTSPNNKQPDALDDVVAFMKEMDITHITPVLTPEQEAKVKKWMQDDSIAAINGRVYIPCCLAPGFHKCECFEHNGERWFVYVDDYGTIDSVTAFDISVCRVKQEWVDKRYGDEIKKKKNNVREYQKALNDVDQWAVNTLHFIQDTLYPGYYISKEKYDLSGIPF